MPRSRTLQGMPPSRSRLRVLAPAKINLHLRVGPVNPDGYHPLLTWMVTVGLFDTLTIESLPASDVGASGKQIEFSCDDPSLPTDEQNIVVRAARALDALKRERELSGSTRLSSSQAAAGPLIRIHLEKRIPHAAGLGGGRSDAAPTLEALRGILE